MGLFPPRRREERKESLWCIYMAFLLMWIKISSEDHVSIVLLPPPPPTCSKPGFESLYLRAQVPGVSEP